MNNKELYYRMCNEIDFLTSKYNIEELKVLVESLKDYIKNIEKSGVNNE